MIQIYERVPIKMSRKKDIKKQLLAPLFIRMLTNFGGGIVPVSIFWYNKLGDGYGRIEEEKNAKVTRI